MNLIMSSILPAFFPAVLDIGKSILAKVFKIQGEPTTIEDRIALMRAQAEFMSNLAQYENPSPNLSRWVNDLRASIRYFLAIFLMLFSGVYVLIGKSPQIADFLLNMDAIIFGFFFGDRVYYHLKEK